MLHPVSSKIACQTFSSVYALPSITPLSHRIIVGYSLDWAISTKMSSSCIWSLIKLIWNLTALLKDILGVWIKAPPFIRMVAASGTCKTLYPICLRCNDNVARAVVLPAHGPPVKHILVMGYLVFLFEFESFSLNIEIASSIWLFLLAIDRSSRTSIFSSLDIFLFISNVFFYLVLTGDNFSLFSKF